jgi:hypothetical protein
VKKEREEVCSRCSGKFRLFQDPPSNEKKWSRQTQGPGTRTRENDKNHRRRKRLIVDWRCGREVERGGERERRRERDREGEKGITPPRGKKTLPEQKVAPAMAKMHQSKQGHCSGENGHLSTARTSGQRKGENKEDKR